MAVFVIRAAFTLRLKGIDMTRMTLKTKFIASLCLASGVAMLAIQAVAAQDVPKQDGPLSDHDRLVKSRACDECALSGSSFIREDLKGVSLVKAVLESASFYRSDLTNANLAGANLSKATLTFANLSNANLDGANLDGANLAEAIGANLITAITTAATTCPDGQAGPCR